MKIFFTSLVLLFNLQAIAQDDEAEIADDTPVTHEEIAGEKDLTAPRSWRAPDFSNQQNALGWSEKAFAVPIGLDARFKFWVDIYSKYTTDQGILHDADNIDLIYEKIDFAPITQRTDINIYKKEALKLKLVKDSKKRVIETLKKLSKLTDPTGLDPHEKEIWDYFAKVVGKHKFTDAMGKNRLRFQLGQRDRVIQGIYFSGRYLEDYEKIFSDAGLPKELTRIPFVESSFNVLARSKVGASGLWQIMPNTGRPYMMMNAAIDKRNHPIEAAKLAAKLLKYNYNLLNSWPLAVTGYNHGPAGVLKLTKKLKTRELGELINNASVRKKFGFASQNFYASFLAALEVESHAQQYLGIVTWSKTLDAVDLKLTKPIKYKDVLRWFDEDDIKAQIYNPHITKAARVKSQFIPKGAIISVMKSKAEDIQKELDTPPPAPEKRRRKSHK